MSFDLVDFDSYSFLGIWDKITLTIAGTDEVIEFDQIVTLGEIVRQLAEREGVTIPDQLGPDEAWCKKCGARVRYGNVLRGGGGTIGIALDADKVEHGAYRLKEEEVDGVYTGRWIATYVRARDRKKTKGFRPHSCRPERIAR